VRRADHLSVITLAALAALLAACGSGPTRKSTPDNEPTLAALAGRKAELLADPGIAASPTQAVTAYRRLLDAAPPAAQRSEAMRRLGDLEMQIADDASATSGTAPNYAQAITRYQTYLQAHPKDPANDRVLYQLARAQELGGQLEASLATLDRVIAEHPNTRYRDETQFRRGELLFNFGKYAPAEKAYEQLIARKSETPFYDRALYMHGWSQFKQGRLDEGLASFFAVLDLKIAGRGDVPLDQVQGLTRADRELVEDTFRITSISLANLQGAEALPKYMTGAPDSPRRSYEFRVYEQLGDLYIKQERVKDAADTFAAFARRQPLHAQAPALQARVIGIYEQGGLPTLAMSAKKDYVSNYGATSEFRRQNPKGWESTAQPLVKTHLAELARHHHALAQKSKTSADYQEAARWYREIITSFPKEPTTARDHFLLSELLYEDKRWAEAATEYDRAAYDYPKNDKSADAAYTGLLARTQLEKTAGANEPAAQRASVAAALKFGDTFKADARTGPVLANAAEKLFALKDGDGAAKVAQQVIALNPPAAPEQRRVAWNVVSLTAFDKGAFGEAEKGYAQVIALTPVTPSNAAARNELTERQAAAVYKQGEKARDAGDQRAAVGHFSRVAQVAGLAPQAAVQSAAQYDAATALIALKDWNGAAAALESFRERFPQHRLQNEASGKLAAIYLEQERFGPAASEFERQAAAQTDPVRARDTLWQAALLHEKANAKPAALSVYERYAKQYPEPLERNLEARWKLVQAEGNNASPRSLAMMREVRDLDARAGAARTDRTRTLGGLSSLALAQPALDEYRKVALVEPLARQLKLKKEKMETVLRAYAQASEYGVAEVVTAATFQTANVYQDFGKSMMDSQRPKGLKPAALEQYNVLLEEQAFPFEEKAIELHEINAKRAGTGVYDEWVQKSFAALRTLKPGRYAKTERSEGVIDAIR
jgi:cellulose synthase operon protein C